MANKQYNILLDNKKIGTTELEKADAPMGVVFGQINFININSGYDFFKSYCLANQIEVTDYPESQLIATMDIPTLKVIDENGNEIKGQGTNVSGMNNDCFEITVLGIPYPFFENAFPHHVQAYNDQFKTDEN